MMKRMSGGTERGSRMVRMVMMLLVAVTMVAYVAGCSMAIERDRHLRYLRPTTNPQKMLANLLDGEDIRNMSPNLINTVTIDLTDKTIRAATAQEKASEITLATILPTPTDQYSYTFSATRTTSAGGEQVLAVQVKQGTTVLAQVQVPSFSENDGLDPEYLAWVSPSLHSVYILTRLPTYKNRLSVIDSNNPQIIAHTQDLENGYEVSLHGMQNDRVEVYDTEGVVYLPWVCCLCINGQYARYTADSLQLLKTAGGDFIDPRHKAVLLLSSRALNLLSYTAESAGVEMHFTLDQLNAVPFAREEGDGTFVDVSCSRNSDCMIVNGEKGPVCCAECGVIDWRDYNYISVNKASWQEQVNDICASTTCLACVPDILDTGIGPLCREDEKTCRKGIVKPDKSCSTDADCRIINEEMGFHDCCGSCGFQDWRPDNYVAVNAQWYSDQGGCMGIYCALCAPGPGNAEARCDPNSQQCYKFVTDDDSAAESLHSASETFF